MLTYVARRLLLSVPVVLFVLVGVFLLIHLTPGNPAAIMLGEEASPAAVAALTRKLGLDLPLPVQFARYLWAVVHGNLGSSLQSGQPVTLLIGQALPVTLELAVLAIAVAVAVSIPLAAVAVIHRGGVVDYVLQVLSLVGVALPNFWYGLILIDLFALTWPILPVNGFQPLSAGLGTNLRYMVLPTVVLATFLVSVGANVLREDLLEAAAEDFMRTARAKGLSRSAAVWRHALRNALLPYLTVMGLQFGGLLGGVVITETVFGVPGIGRLIVNAIFNRDFPLLQGGVLFFAVVVVLVNLATDLLYAVMDPRVTYR
ncbi:MAG: ABC transporter permease [Firmicutes bacterium]|nr:ABC transporter permease [Bacillota bacterium]